MRCLLPIAALALPLGAEARTLKEIVNGTIVPLGDLIVTVLYALAFVFFLIGVARYFFAENFANGEEVRKQGKDFALWSILAFFVLFAVWGLVNVLLGVLGDSAS